MLVGVGRGDHVADDRLDGVAGDEEAPVLLAVEHRALLPDVGGTVSVSGTTRFVHRYDPRMPTLTPLELKELDQHARGVGRRLGHSMRVFVPSNEEYLALTVMHEGIEHSLVGPARVSDMAAHDIDWTLDLLSHGACQIVLTEDDLHLA